MKNLDVIAPALVIIGALNLGLAGLFHLMSWRTLWHEVRTNVCRKIRRVRPGRVVRVYQALTWKSIQCRWHTACAPARGVNVRWRYHFVRNVVKDMDIKPRLLMSVFALALTSINS